MLFHKYLKNIRDRVGISLPDLSKKLDASYASARMWEVGVRIAGQEFVHKLETFYELPAGTIQSRIVKISEVKIIYICHSLRSGNIQKNRENISQICKQLSAKYKDILILSPIHTFSYISTDGEQTDVLAQGAELLTLADELWVFGDYKNSEACQLEIRTAKELKIPAMYKK